MTKDKDAAEGTTHWNYRVMRHEKNGEVSFTIHEVFYSGDKPVAFTVEPTYPFGETLEELIAGTKHYAKALEHPVLTPADFSHMLGEADEGKHDVQ